LQLTLYLRADCGLQGAATAGSGEGGGVQRAVAYCSGM